jgi:UDP-2,3-diacylglucosamine hydrolase
MADVTLFISDLHLSAARPAVTELFLTFLQTEARAARALYILGDLFEYWIGDEAATTDEHGRTVAAMRALADHGVPLYVMHGNRDFLMGTEFARLSGATLLEDPTVIDLYGERTLLMHGDTLCTRDTEHLKFREMVHAPSWQREFLAKPIAEREGVARHYRELSKTATSMKARDIMDVEQIAVEATMRAHGVQRLLHGHTHRPAEHTFMLDGKPARRTVLGDWYEQGSVLRVTPARQTLAQL